MKTGIMGGTFDPIHTGHLVLGEQAWQELNLDTVMFMPSGNPPHKTDRRGRASNEDRLAMVSLAIADNPHFECSDFEMKRTGYIYTFETLELLKKERPQDDFYFIIGADSLFEFDLWRMPERICRNCTLVAAIRGGFTEAALDLRIKEVSRRYGARIERLHIPGIEISSNMIRTALKEGRSVRYYLPEAVRDYIYENRIYISS